MSLPVATRIRVSGFLHVASAPRVLFEESRTLCWPLERRFLAALPPFSRRRKGGWVEWSCEEGNGIAAAAAIPFTREKASGGVSLVRGLEDEAKGRGGFSGGVSSLQRRSAPSASLAKKQRASTSWGSDFRGGGSSANAESGFASYSPQRPRHSAFLGSSPAVIRLVTLAVQVAREGSGNSAFWNRICASAAQVSGKVRRGKGLLQKAEFPESPSFSVLSLRSCEASSGRETYRLSSTPSSKSATSLHLFSMPWPSTPCSSYLHSIAYGDWRLKSLCTLSLESERRLYPTAPLAMTR